MKRTTGRARAATPAMRPPWRRGSGGGYAWALTTALLLLTFIGVAGAQTRPAGTMTWGLHFTIAPTFFDPAEASGLATPFLFLYAMHDALIKPMPEGLLTPAWRNPGPKALTDWSTIFTCAQV